jgi:predicted  nucleic acid-binding Zn-ribbon protein
MSVVHKLTVPINVPVNVPIEDVQSGVQSVLREKVTEELDRATSTFKEDVVQKVRVLQDDANKMLEKVSDKHFLVDETLRRLAKAVEDFKDELSTKSSRILIPAAIAVMVACAVGAWGVLGGTIVGMRAEGDRVNAASQDLERRYAATEQQLIDLSNAIEMAKAKLGGLNDAIEKARKNSGAVNEEPRLAKLEAADAQARLAKLEAAISRTDGRLDTLSQFASAKAAAPTVVAPSAPAPTAKGSETGGQVLVK